MIDNIWSSIHRMAQIKQPGRDFYKSDNYCIDHGYTAGRVWSLALGAFSCCSGTRSHSCEWPLCSCPRGLDWAFALLLVCVMMNPQWNGELRASTRLRLKKLALEIMWPVRQSRFTRAGSQRPILFSEEGGTTPLPYPWLIADNGSISWHHKTRRTFRARYPTHFMIRFRRCLRVGRGWLRIVRDIPIFSTSLFLRAAGRRDILKKYENMAGNINIIYMYVCVV